MPRRPPLAPAVAIQLLGISLIGAHCHSSEPAAPAAPVVDSGSSSAPPNEGLTDAEAQKFLPGVETASLSPKQRQDLVDLAGDTFCPCSAATVSTCLRQGPPCPAARRLLDLAKKMIANGQPEATTLLRVETYYGSFPEDKRVTVAAEGPSRGPEDARIQLVEFSDFQCPACRAAHPALEDLVQKYPADVRWVFRNYPLPQHEHAEAEAAAGVFAYEHGKFWPLADWFFGHQDQLGEDNFFKDAAKAVGLDPTALLAATTDPRMKAKVEADKADGTALKIGGTPSIFINGRQLVLAPTLEYLSWTVEDELEWLSSGRKWASR
jgi:protein-disulfide isomerase